MTLRKGEDTGNWKRKHQIAPCGELALGEAMDLSDDIVWNKWIKDKVHTVTTVLDSVKAHWNVSAYWGIKNICTVSRIFYVRQRPTIQWGLRWKRLPRRPRWAWENSSVYFFAVHLTDSAVARSGKHNTLLALTFFAPARLEWSLGRQMLTAVHCNCITHDGVLNIAVLIHSHLKCYSQLASQSPPCETDQIQKPRMD